MSNQPTDSEIRAALARILASPSFCRSGRAQAFLRFVTEETLAGGADKINGYSIALRVFRRPADFDAANDPLVRVEAGRVRSRLRDYYVTAGRDDGVRIELPRGGYVPTFGRSLPTRVPELDAEPRVRFRWLVTLSAAALIAVAWAVGVGLLTPSSRPAGVRELPSADIRRAHSERASPRVFVRTFRNLGSPESLPLALGITEEVMTRLGKYSEVRVIVAPGDVEAGGVAGNDSLAAAADYELTGSLRAEADRIHVLPRLVDTRTGQQVWAAAYDEPRAVDNVWKIVDDAASAVARALGEPYGPLFDAEVARAVNTAAEATDEYHCMLRFVFALEVISEAAHGRATTCFEQAVAADPNSSMSWARLAALYRMEYLHDFNPRNYSSPALERADAAAKRALALDPSNAFAHQEMAFLCLLHDDSAGFEESTARALALDPSADLRAAIGINFVKIGQPERGFALLDEGIAESPRAPPFFFLGYAVHALRMHDYDGAFKWAQRMATPDWPLSQAMLAAVAALTNHEQEAHRAARRLLELRPDFAATGRELVARGRLGPETEAALVEGLARAGVVLL